MKIKLFTHTDLDGRGCYIVIKSLFPEPHVVDVTYCDYDNVDKKVQRFVNSKHNEEYEYVFITDISVNEDTADILNDLNKSDMGPFVQLLDHHDTALWLNDYEWAHVNPVLRGRPGHKSSGTSLIMDFFEYQRPGFERKPSPGIRHFAEQVRRYDTWEWFTHYDTILPKELNDYLYMVGAEKFTNLMLATIPSNDPGKEVYFDVTARALLDHKQVEIKSYIAEKNKQLIKCNSNDNKYGVVFAEQHISELGNELCKLNKDIDFVVIVDMGEKKLSLRTIRDDIHLGELAKTIGGGGHPKAAGASINDDKITNFLFNLF